jgi:hypothetical protein
MPQSPLVLRPSAQDATVVRPEDVVGGSEVWALVTQWEGGAWVDNSGYLNSSGITADGEVSAVPAVGAVVIRTGYQHDAPMVTALLSAVLPDFDETSPFESIELLYQITSMPASTAKWGCSIGLTDSAPANVATSIGALANCYPNSAVVWNVGVSSAAGLQTNVSQGGTQPEWLWARIRVNPGTRGVQVIGAIRNTAGTWQSLTTFTGEVGVLSATVANWRIVVKAIHVAAVGGTQLQAGRLYARMSRHSDFPSVATPGKAAAGTQLIVLLNGDSIGDGIGADPTGTGGDELAYGGAAMIAGCLLLDSNGGVFTDQPTYPDNAGAAPENPGLVPHIHRRAKELGYTGATVYRYSVSGASTPTTLGFIEQSMTLLHPLGVVPHLVVVVSGTNDANNGTESAAFEAMIEGLYTQVERHWPGARIAHVEPIAAIGAKSEADVIRASIQAHVANKNTRYAVAGAGLAAHDTIHPTLATYSAQGEGVADGYVASG